MSGKWDLKVTDASVTSYAPFSERVQGEYVIFKRWNCS